MAAARIFVRTAHDPTRRPTLRRPDRIAVDIDRTARGDAGAAGTARGHESADGRAECSERRAARLAGGAAPSLPRRGIALRPAPDAGLARRPVAPRAPPRPLRVVVGGRRGVVLLSVPDLSLSDL